MAAIRGIFIAAALGLASASAWAGVPAAASWSLASPKGEARATFAADASGLATVLVERRAANGWSVAWRSALQHDATAGNALLADDGRLLLFSEAALDGADALVLHDARGRIVRELDLGQFLPADYLRALPRDGRGLHWRRGARLAETQDAVEFSVAVPGSAAGETGPALRFNIDLANGRLGTAQIREYLVAADRARALAAATASAQHAPDLSGKVAVVGRSRPAESLPR